MSDDATRGGLRPYIQIARPDHWIKNIFVLPGAAAAYAVTPHTASAASLLTNLAVGLISVCLCASANYTINEYLDAAFDRFHPLKKQRPGAMGALSARLVLAEYYVLAGLGLAIGWLINPAFMICAAWLLVMGIIYNVQPMRSKDRAYLDVLSEAINNPIRFLMGWFAVTAQVVPPVSVLFAYWMGGAFLMAVKRYSEFRRIGDAAQAGLYRRSFLTYSETSLLLSSFFYAICSAFFIGIFLIKYRVGLVLTFPLYAALFTWYLAVGLRRDSAAQAPEKLYREVALMSFAAFTFLVTALLFIIDVPFLDGLTSTKLLPLP